MLKNEFGVSPLRNPPLRNVYKLGVNVIGRDPPFHLSLRSLPNADRSYREHCEVMYIFSGE